MALLLNKNNRSYLEKRHLIKSGDLIVWGTKSDDSFLSFRNLIKFFTASDFVHTAVAWNKSGRIFVLDAVMPRIRLKPLSDMRQCYLVPMNIHWNDGLEKKLLSYVGQEYSVPQAIMSYFTRPLKDDKWHCVEVVKDFYEYAGLKIDSKYIPGDFVEAAIKKRNTSIVRMF